MLFKDIKNIPTADFTQEYKELDYCGQTIKVYQNISTRDKNDLIWATLAKAKENITYNPIKATMYMHLNMVYLFTDIVFEPDDRLDEFELYDNLNECGLMRQIIGLIPADLYEKICDIVDKEIIKQEKVNSSTVSLVQSLINDLPNQVEAAAKIVENFDPEKFEAVKKFAEAANGGRTIDTNEPTAKTEPVKKPVKKIIKKG